MIINDMKKRAKVAMALRPSFVLLHLSPENLVGNSYKAKIFNVRCRLCGVETLRSLEWLNSRYGCPCTRAEKTSKSLALSAEEFTEKWKFRKRKLVLTSEYKNMHTRIMVKCLACAHEWLTAPTNIRHAGCPKCAPERTRRATMKKYGVEHTSQLPSVQKKIRRTMRARYEVAHALQNPDLLDKMVSSSYLKKSYRLGKNEVLVQGYEPYALDYLQRERKLKPRHIVCGVGSDLPRIKYTINGRRKIYHPDIFIPEQNLIIEVKSVYTYKRYLEKNKLKADACCRAGYAFEFLVMNRDGTLYHAYKTDSH